MEASISTDSRYRATKVADYIDLTNSCAKRTDGTNSTKAAANITPTAKSPDDFFCLIVKMSPTSAQTKKIIETTKNTIHYLSLLDYLMDIL